MRFVCVSELEGRQKRGALPADALLLTVPDPHTRLGSGGATLNALLVAAEHLSARAGYSVRFTLLWRALCVCVQVVGGLERNPKVCVQDCQRKFLNLKDPN